MPDPAEIIATTILNPPVRQDVRILQSVSGDGTENGLQWSYRAAMAHPAAPDLAQHIAEAAVRALAEAGWQIIRGQHTPAALPSADQIRGWLLYHDWIPAGGMLWSPPDAGRQVIVPDSNGDPQATEGAVRRIADRMGMPLDQVLWEMMQGD